MTEDREQARREAWERYIATSSASPDPYDDVYAQTRFGFNAAWTLRQLEIDALAAERDALAERVRVLEGLMRDYFEAQHNYHGPLVGDAMMQYLERYMAADARVRAALESDRG